MGERVDHPGVAGAVPLVRITVTGAPCTLDSSQSGVGVGHREHQAHRGLAALRRHDADLGRLVRQVDESSSDAELAVPDAFIWHDDGSPTT
jgi:hypothetical protein